MKIKVEIGITKDLFGMPMWYWYTNSLAEEQGAAFDGIHFGDISYNYCKQHAQRCLRPLIEDDCEFTFRFKTEHRRTKQQLSNLGYEDAPTGPTCGKLLGLR